MTYKDDSFLTSEIPQNGPKRQQTQPNLVINIVETQQSKGNSR